MYENNKPYKIRNMIVKKLETNDSNTENTENNNENNKENIEYGYLQVIVYNSDNKPIANAETRVYLIEISGLYDEKGEGLLMGTSKTDENGYAPIYRLPSLNRLQRAENQNNNSIYAIAIEAEGYYSAYAFDIQIYPNITTSYNIHLQNISENQNPYSQFEFIIEPRIPDRL